MNALKSYTSSWPLVGPIILPTKNQNKRYLPRKYIFRNEKRNDKPHTHHTEGQSTAKHLPFQSLLPTVTLRSTPDDFYPRAVIIIPRKIDWLR